MRALSPWGFTAGGTQALGLLRRPRTASHSHPFLRCLFPFSFLLFKYTHKSPLNKNIPWDLSSPCSSQHELSSYTDNFFFSFCFVLLKCSWFMGQVYRRIHKLLQWVVHSGDVDHDFPGFWGFPSPPLMALLCSLWGFILFYSAVKSWVPLGTWHWALLIPTFLSSPQVTFPQLWLPLLEMTQIYI